MHHDDKGHGVLPHYAALSGSVVWRFRRQVSAVLPQINSTDLNVCHIYIYIFACISTDIFGLKPSFYIVDIFRQ